MMNGDNDGPKLNLRCAVTQLQKNISEKTTELAQLENAIIEAEQRNANVDKRLDNLAENHLMLSMREAEAKAAVEALENERDDVMELHTQALYDLQYHEEMIEKLKDEIHEATLEGLKESSDVFQTFIEHASVSNQLSDGQSVESTKKDLEEKIAAQTQNLASVENANEELKNELVTLEDRSKSMDMEEKNLNQQALEDQMAKIQKEELEVNEKIQRLEEEIRQQSASNETEEQMEAEEQVNVENAGANQDQEAAQPQATAAKGDENSGLPDDSGLEETQDQEMDQDSNAPEETADK